MAFIEHLFTGQSLLLLLLLSPLCLATWRLVFDPLSRVPGPFIARITPLWLWYRSWKGDEASQIWALHKQFGPIVRVGPQDIDIADGAALYPIYTEQGGLLKSPCYANFHVEGHPTIFSTLDPEHRKPRAKAIVPLFATGSIYSNSEQIFRSADIFISRLREGSASGRSINVLNLARSYALDSLSTYLFGKCFDGLREEGEHLSASKFVDFFVAFGRFFYFPDWLFTWTSWVCEKLLLDNDTAVSMARVDSYAHTLVEEAARHPHQKDQEETYQGRLLRAGFSKHETEQQCKDLIFAGTDSTGMNVATLCWQLARPKNRSAYDNLRKEICEAEKAGELSHGSHRIQGLQYLRAVVLEGLRISNANPTRLPRVVGPDGWDWQGFSFPPGTSVGVGAHQLHHNDAIFPKPQEFQPERWLDPSTEMQRDSVAFGVGARQCIARNLAMAELLIVLARIAQTDALSGFQAVGDKIEIVEWFNSMVPGGKIELEKIESGQLGCGALAAATSSDQNWSQP